MSWIDAGVNLLDPRFTLTELFIRSTQADVNHMLVISSTIEESQLALALCQDVHDKTHQHIPFNTSIKLATTAGIHPHHADHATLDSWVKLKRLIADKHVVAIGECGLDFNRNFSSPKNQLYAFEKQLEIAAKNHMGVYLHERDAFDQQIELLAQYADSLKFMVSHCFTGTVEHLQAYLSLGCYVGVTGWLCDTKRGKDLQQAVQHLPLSRLLLETDSPYLFPKTLKPRRSVNEPSNLPYIAECFARLTSQDVAAVKKHAFENAHQLFFQPQNDV